MFEADTKPPGKFQKNILSGIGTLIFLCVQCRFLQAYNAGCNATFYTIAIFTVLMNLTLPRWTSMSVSTDSPLSYAETFESSFWA